MSLVLPRPDAPTAEALCRATSVGHLLKHPPSHKLILHTRLDTPVYFAGRGRVCAGAAADTYR